jgi:phosphoribosyl-AMP cyclohydrolase
VSQDQEESTLLSPRFDERGLLTAIAQDVDTGEVLMLAHMNREALDASLETGIAHYWSRSRAQLWKKGESSGEVQNIVEMLFDCDQDAVLLKVRVQAHGTACHTGRKSCFYRRVENGGLAMTQAPIIDPKQLYRK